MAKLKEKAEAVLKNEPCKKGEIDLSKIDAALLGIKKEIGEDSIVDTETVLDIPRMPTKSPTLGWIEGGGGTPIGRIIELFGNESSGKSLLAQNIGADFQKAGRFVAYIDSEYSFSARYANIQGLATTPNLFKLFQPNTAEDVFTIAEKLAQSGQVGLIIIDSLAEMVPKAELEGSMTDQQMGLAARVIGKGLRRLTATLAKNNCTLILISQYRMKIGISFGDPRVTSGGNSPKFYSSIRLEVSKAETTNGENDGDDATGIKCKVVNKKNKTSIPFRKGELFFSFTEGIDIYGEYVDFGVSMGFIQKGGAWYTIEGERAQGRANAILCLKNNPTLFETIKSKVDAQLAGNPLVDVKLPETIVDTSIESLAEQAGK